MREIRSQIKCQAELSRATFYADNSLCNDIRKTAGKLYVNFGGAPLVYDIAWYPFRRPLKRSVWKEKSSGASFRKPGCSIMTRVCKAGRAGQTYHGDRLFILA